MVLYYNLCFGLLQVHARDIIDRLLKAGCSSRNAFEWQSQLRFYWVSLIMSDFNLTCGSVCVALHLVHVYS